MPTVGETLRKTREARKLRVEEVAEATNMRSDHIIALEEGNYAPFPAPVYVRGSVRTYAKLLKLDVMPIMDALSAELAQREHNDHHAEGRLPRRGVVEFLAYQLASFGWKRSLALLILLVAIAILLLSKATRSRQAEQESLSKLPPPTYQSADSDSGYLPLPGTNQ